MTRGKSICKILKDIRRQIAEANDIEYITSECRYQGECLGTCPKCEAEVRYLEQQLRQRQSLGRAVAIAGISASLFACAACSSTSTTSEGDDAILEGDIELSSDSVKLSQFIIEEDTIAENDIKSDTLQNQSGLPPIATIIIGVPGDPEVNEIRLPDKYFDSVRVAPPVFSLSEEIDEVVWVKNHVTAQLDSAGNVIRGRVLVNFDVTVDGNITNAKVVRSADARLNDEALRVVNMMPRYVPAQQGGKPITYNRAIPVYF